MRCQRNSGEHTEDADSGVDQGRRAAIAKMGGIAAPAFVMLLTADASEAWSASGKPKPRKPKPRIASSILARFL